MKTLEERTHCVEQGTLEWLRLRLGRPTASEFHNFITPAKLDPSAGKGMLTYVYEKVAERILGHALPSFTSFVTEHGKEMEGQARAWYAMETGEDLRQVGFIEAQDGKSGCSPDGLADAFGVEIKAPNAETHVRYLDEGILPTQYAPQVHGSLYVTGLTEWHFVSYRRPFPPFVLIVKRDAVIMEKIAKGLANFHAEFDRVLEKLTTKKA